MEKGLPIFSKNRATLFWQNDHSTRGEHQHKAKLTILKPTPFSSTSACFRARQQEVEEKSAFEDIKNKMLWNKIIATWQLQSATKITKD